MDERLRSLQREAQAGDQEAAERLAGELARIGRDALRYTGPDPVPERVVDPPSRDSCPRAVNYKLGVPRHRTICAAGADAMERAIERRTRRAGRFACEEGYQEWLESRDS